MSNKRKTIRHLIQTIHLALREIYQSQPIPSSDFALGQIYAYLVLQCCPNFRNLGLDYDIKKKFPLPEK